MSTIEPRSCSERVTSVDGRIGVVTLDDLYEPVVTRVYREYRGANITLTGGAGWVAIDAATLDIVFNGVSAGDTIEVDASLLWSSAGAGNGLLDFATIVSAAPVNYFSSAGATPDTNGLPHLFGAASATSSRGGTASYVLVADDISGGSVRLRLMGKAATVNKILSVGGAAGNGLKLGARHIPS